MQFQRADRVGEEMKKLISKIIREEIKDHEMPDMVSIVNCEMSRDLQHAKIFVSVLGGDEARAAAMRALQRANGFIRSRVGRELKLRLTPELHFVPDTSMEYSAHISKLIDEVIEKDKNSGGLHEEHPQDD